MWNSTIKRSPPMMASIPTRPTLRTFTPEHTKTFGVRSGFVMDEVGKMDGNEVERQADAVTETVKNDGGKASVTVIKTLL